MRRGKNLSTSVRLGASLAIAMCSRHSCREPFTAAWATPRGITTLSNRPSEYSRPSTSIVTAPESSVIASE